MTLSKVLIANRGEIAIRIARAAASCGLESVAIFAAVDAQSLHVQVADQAVQLLGDGVAAYLDVDAVIAAAQNSGCDCIHPGYGFLSENAALAIACEKAALTFVGPSSDALALFGDKLQARALAQKLGISVVGGSEGSLSSVADAQAIAAKIGYPIMLKAAAGGGGRGMREVHSDADLVDAFARSASEALAAFGRGDLFVERLVANPKHIEVQVLGDAQGNLVHLYERDCSIQLRHQKVLEFAPAPNLDAQLREKILAAAVQLAGAVDYTNAGTVEFLVEPETGEFFFIECNPRIQVEHTVTEQVLGLDLVSCQFAIAGGASLASLGFANQAAVPTPRGFAIQARVVAQGAGTITSYKEPAGVGVRVDACGYLGCTPPAEFDPLLAKVICTTPVGSTFASAVQLTVATLQQYQVAGLATNLVQLQNVLSHPSVVAGDARTTLLRDTPELLDVVKPKASGALVFLQQQATLVSSSLQTNTRNTSVSASGGPALARNAGEQAVSAPMGGGVVAVDLVLGAQVKAGDTLLVISAMKMESLVLAPVSGQLVAIGNLSVGDTVAANQDVAVIAPDAAAIDAALATEYGDNSWAPMLQNLATLKALAAERLLPGSTDPGVVRQRKRGKLTCRERIELLLDGDSFREVGSIAGFASYDEEGEIAAFTPANSVGGWGEIEGRTTIVCADDFTSRGGHADGAIGAKSTYLDRLSIELNVPSVRLLDGSSGGGSVAAMVPAQKSTGDSTAKESTGAIKAGRPRVAGGGGSFLPGHLGSSMYAEQLSRVPVVNVLLGSVVGLGAAKAVLGHFSVMVRDVAQLFVAGPPVVSHAMGYDITKEELGGWHIHCRNGSVDNLAEDEAQAMDMSKRFLSYLPASVYEAPPVAPVAVDDPPERREEELFTLIPRKRTTTFDMRKAIRLMADHDSFFEIGPLWGTDQITGFVRFAGRTLGVIASDSQHANGGALTADGCDKLTRHLDLCDLFHIPVLNLIDNPGFAVGLEHEIASTIRKGGRWMVAFAQISVPVFTLVMRRSFGVAGNNYATPRSKPSMRVVWPAADTGGIPPEGGIEAAYKRQLAEAEDPVALRAELEARIETARGPIGPLNKFQIEEMIDPRDSRRYICDWVHLAYKVVSQPAKLVPRALQFRP